ncbi:tetratricopeptide repeat protein [Bacillus pseudomycoides]|uniref:Rap family tetratricopeptide repeat protein n=1 Tax=Bacillus pseudomycoides TaxID=64104 RepID=UPI0001A18D94|nr:Rap family tetratricopeptide repeat protein [Bacillus pseudomycoides]EEM13381.1 Response regulator aspartate phosphatase [Bacillus pseudomycoides DSM 12442]MED1599577.1 tetratricopeptide repeat protein [Bacillus pseudomycoides]PEU32911.1 tetratricopeptide repeat-containing protein [Bacillus pseudomycoides]
MNIQLKGNERLTELLNEWYLQIRARNRENSIRLKKEIEQQLHNLTEDQNLLFYYSLLDFRYNYLINNMGISRNSFDKIENFNTPREDFLAYYYHFFKAIHSNAIGSYNLAKEHYEKAESLLVHIPDDLEKAEFYYNLAIFNYHIYQALFAIKYANIANDIFAQNSDCELKIAYCKNLLGLSCTHLKEYEMAEEYFISAIDLFRKFGNERDILIARQNLGLMYSEQKQFDLAIRYLSEVNEKIPNNYRALLIEAKQRIKVQETVIASELIKKGLHICNELEILEYQHHFHILDKLCNEEKTEILEKVVLAGMEYFKKEGLWEYIQEYSEILALKFHNDAQFEKSSSYFLLTYQAKEEILEREVLK